MTSMRNPNPYYCIVTNFNLFQNNAYVSTGCTINAGICKSVEKSHPGLNEEKSRLSIGKLKGPPSFIYFVDDKSKYLV